MSWQVSEREPGGITELVSFDNDDDGMFVRRIQNCDFFLDRAHQWREHGNWRGDDNDFWRVASVPNVIIEEWMRQGINVFSDADWPKVKALLNGPYKYLKMAPVTI